ncbi:nucleotidyltransferase [Sporosarcina sp. Te-1]|nr:nucleotidyltransferase [Sporosarcina sp. Te-1]QTD42417.1 nucleotidyltransferase [Sporosarcina sp. Te-1]
MKATGIVVEYNPFHNGHLHHVQEAKKRTGADVMIAVMSGNFLQRGEPAFVDKWTRAEMALRSGVDLVFELPYRFATANAPLFAKGAIKLLDAAHCCAYCFGSEDGSIQPFLDSLELIEQHRDSYDEAVKEAMASGVSYPKALNMAYIQVLASSQKMEPPVDLAKPNNILGYHYMEAARDLHSQMIPVTIPRIVAQYHDDAIAGNAIASATGIRKTFFSSASLEEVSGFLPEATEHLLHNWQQERSVFGSWDYFYPYLRLIIVREGPSRLASIADIVEGMENAIYKAALSNQTFGAFMEQIKSKRYTWTRIQRMITHILTGFTSSLRDDITEPSYLRLLGMTSKGKDYLNRTKKELKLPLISKVASYQDLSLSADIRASDIYALGIAQKSGNAKLGLDYLNRPLILES